MADLQRQAAAVQNEWIAKLAEHCTHQLTLHTNLSTYNRSASTIERYETQAQSALYYFIPRLNRALTGNGWRRKAEYKPVIIPSLEGTLNTYDKNRTLHWHILLGNLPKHCTTEQLATAARTIWLENEHAKDNISCTQLWYSIGFSGYIQKEKHKGNFDCVATHYIQAPTQALQ